MAVTALLLLDDIRALEGIVVFVWVAFVRKLCKNMQKNL